jgi:RecA-family ATPase
LKAILSPKRRSPRTSKRTGHHRDAQPFLKLINPAGLEGKSVPERRWLVPNWIPLARATSIYGAGGEGKTLLAQMLATACAIGKPWLGQSTMRCNSVLQFCEDDLDEMHRRQEDINRHYECTFADLGAMRWLPRLGDDNALMDFAGGRPQLRPLFDQLVIAACDHKARLVIADTLADVFAGNENDRSQARAFAQSALGYLARETKGAVVALAHPSRSGMSSGTGESGSTAWIGTFRSQLYLSTPASEDGDVPDPDARILTRKKSNAARRDETIELRWRNGVFIADQPATGIIASIERKTCDRVFLDLLDKVATEGRHVSETLAPQTTRRSFSGSDQTARVSERLTSSAPCSAFSLKRRSPSVAIKGQTDMSMSASSMHRDSPRFDALGYS